MDTRRNDRGSIVIGWLTKLVVCIAVAGLVLFDAGAVVAAHLNATDDANNAASAAAIDWQNNHNLASAFSAAEDTVTNIDETLLNRGFRIDADGTVHVELRRQIQSVLIKHVGPLRKRYSTVVVSGEASPPTL